MLNEEERANALNMAMNIEGTGFDPLVMGFYFDNWMATPIKRRMELVTFWKSTPVGFRLYCELMRKLEAPEKRAITFTV